MIHYDPRAVHGALTHPHGPPGLPATMERIVADKHAAQTQVPWQQLRARVHAIKRYAVANLGWLLTEFEKQFSARGGTVLWARTADEAAAHFLDICKRHGVRSVVKGKSMLSEELELNERLATAGIDAVETDLGEYIVQLAGQKPSHIIAPALHLSRQDIGKLFAAKLGIEYTDDPQTLLAAARARLRTRYLEAGLGMTGVNFAIAESGTIVTVENEGNQALSAAAPPVYVALMGIEKVIPRLLDLPPFLHVLARAATGQKLSVYTHHFLGPEDGRTWYCIIIDAGRTNVLADEATRESLYCIRCGACMNVCPIYRRVGGWAYGWVYPGPIGSVETPQMIGVERAGELPFASSLCGACQHECPVNIDLPHQLVYMRHKAVQRRAMGKGLERSAFRFWARAMSSLPAYKRAVRLARFGTAASARIGWKPGPLAAWTRYRDLPPIAAETFKEWWERRAQS
ncbi:MAG TPA: lactate utilization protein B [Candidatus Binatus sp.]|nr:lactate utilization protein B [Candidatus Binatus sp.]